MADIHEGEIDAVYLAWCEADPDSSFERDGGVQRRAFKAGWMYGHEFGFEEGHAADAETERATEEG